MKDYAEDVIRFTREQTRPIKEIGGDTVLQTELGLDGDDAVEFFDRFFKTFGVDPSQFQFDDHFGSERSISPWSLLRSIFFKRQIKLGPITVENLIEAANTKIWVYRRK